jgi:hypothetical protein
VIQVYPHSSALILNDSIFTEFGGQTGSFTQGQRNAAYLIAEKQATAFLNTFLLPTVVTGTFGYAPRIATDYGYVHEILSVGVLSKDSYVNCTLQSKNGCVFVWDDTYGYLDVGCLVGACNCGNVLVPYQIQVAYTAGLPTGVANQPDVLLALTMAAQISLNEMIYPSQNEGTGDIGIEEFRSLDYSEKRKTLKHTIFGSSAKAQKIAGLLAAAVKPARQVLMLR